MKKIKITEKELREKIRGLLSEALSLPSSFSSKIENLVHFKNIPLDVLKRKYLDLSVFLSSAAYGGRFRYDSGAVLNEEAEVTLSPELTRKEICPKFNLDEWQFQNYSIANNIELILLLPDIAQNVQNMRDAMAACGWSLSTKETIGLDGMTWTAMTFDPMFQNDISSEAFGYGVLYHWSPSYNKESILKHGLIPKSENRRFDYPERVHVLKGSIPYQMLISIGQELSDANSDERNNGDYILFSVNTAKIPRGTEVYYDPRFEWGLYLKTSIPADALKVVLEYRFDFEK